ncbi:MAG: bifunctional UDP-sugar hydrolase/5'-nucleotidase [Myxococcota bacterium]
MRHPTRLPSLVSAALAALAACHPPPAAPEPEPGVTLHIAATNDFHGGLYEAAVKGEEGAFGGLPWLSAAVGSLREEHPDLLLLDGGDCFQGSWPVNASQGRGGIEAMALLGVDAAAIGNHEFDYGGVEGADPLRGALETAAASAPYPLLSANIFRADGSRYAPDNIAPWTLLERDGVKIAVVGLTTTETPNTTLPEHVADLTFADPVTTVKALLPEIEASGAQVRILVAHLTGACEPTSYVRNDDACTPDGEIGRLLTELPVGTFDAMILGHAHTVLHHRVGDTFLLEDRSVGHLLGQLELVVGPDGVDADASRVLDPWPIQHPAVDPGCEDRPFPLDPVDVGGHTLAPDPEALALVDRLEAEAGSLCDEIGCASRTLTRSRQGESELGSWMADAMLASVEGAEVALQNSGGIRADLPEGAVRRESLQRVMPFDNRIVVLELTGAELRRALRIGTSGAHGVLQIAGASYAYDPARAGGTDLDGDGVVSEWEQDKLCSVTVGGKPLDDARTYKVVTSDFLQSGGDHLGPALSAAKVVETGPFIREILWDAASNTQGCLGDAPATPRITVGACK